MFEPYEKGLYHNVLDMSLNTTYPFVNDILKKHNITNPMRELTNSENIYYAVSDDFKSNVKLLNRYIQEHYDSKAYYSLVKKIHGLNVYKFNDAPINIPNKERIGNTENVEYQVEEEVYDDKTSVSGYAYVEGEDSFSQNIYVVYENDNNDIVYVFYGTQIENEEKKNENKYHGKYSGFYCNIRNSEYNLKDLKLKIYVENQNGVYVVEP